MTPKHRGGSVSAGIRIAVTVSGEHWFAAPVFDGMTDVEAWEEAEWALPSGAERRRFIVGTTLDGTLVKMKEFADSPLTGSYRADYLEAQAASLRELVEELREALQARVEGEGGTAAERALLAKAKALGDE